MSEEIQLKILRAVEKQPSISQRELAKELGISLGKTNYCVKALIEKGWLKAKKFGSRKNKLSAVYLLTPKGIQRKTELTKTFLKRKMQEYEELKAELERIKREL